MEKRTITVKGVGTASVKPDFVVLTLTVETLNTDYNEAMHMASSKIEQLQTAIMEIGFDKSDLKTTSFDVHANYTTKKDWTNKEKRVFLGYFCSYGLSLSFDFDNARLNKTLTAISACESDPDLSIEFTVKNPAEITEEILRSASKNAMKKAEILCSGAGASLGELLTINYNWAEISYVSGTRYRPSGFSIPRVEDMITYSACIEPEEIKASDTATFIWEIS